MMTSLLRAETSFLRFIKTPILAPSAVSTLEALNLQFATAEDASAAVMHLASDTSLNGRAIAVVTRDEDPRGYLDLREDDPREGEFLFRASRGASKATHRIRTRE